MLDGMDRETARALLEWQIELGADEAIGDMPVDRYALGDSPQRAEAPPRPAVAPSATQPAAAATVVLPDPVVEARQLASTAADLSALAEAIAAFPHCELRRGARNCVFADGRAGARVMVIGEAPGREEDQRGLPFVGRAGQLLDRMFAAIGMGRESPDAETALYITNILPWRPPENRRPTAEECAMMLPFVERHVELAAPEVLVLMGNTPLQTILGGGGITRRRGMWSRALGLPVLPMFHPAYLLRTPSAKREAWADLLSLQARLRGDA